MSTNRAFPFGFGFLVAWGAAVLLAANYPLWLAVIGGTALWGFYELTGVKPRFKELWPLAVPSIACLGPLLLSRFHLDDYQVAFVRIFLAYLSIPLAVALWVGLIANKISFKKLDDPALASPALGPLLLAFATWIFYSAWTQQENMNCMSHVNLNLAYNISRGSLQFSQSDMGVPMNIFGWHFFPTWLLAAPIYRLLSFPETLIALQTLGITAAAYFIYRFAQQAFRQSFLIPLGLTLGFMFSIPVSTSNMWAVEIRVISVGFCAGMLYFLFREGKRNVAAFWIFLLLFLGCGEANAFLLAPLGLYLLINKQTRRDGVIIFVLAIVYFVAAQKIGAWVNHGYYRYAKAQGEYMQYFHDPLAGIRVLVSPHTIIVFALFMLAGSYLCVLEPFFWVILPALALNFLDPSSRMIQYSYGYMPMYAFMVFAGVKALEKWQTRGTLRFAKNLAVGPTLVTLHLLSAVILTGPTFLTLYNERQMETPMKFRIARTLAHKIPAEADVSASALLESELASRKNLYYFPRQGDVPPEVRQAFKVNYENLATRDNEYVIVDVEDSLLENGIHSEYLKVLLDGKGYGVWDYDAGVLVFRKGETRTLWDHIHFPPPAGFIGEETASNTPTKQPLTLVHVDVYPPSAGPGEDVRIDYYWRWENKPVTDIFILTEFERIWPDHRFSVVHQPIYGMLRPEWFEKGEVFKDSRIVRLPTDTVVARKPLTLRVSVLEGAQSARAAAQLQTRVR